MAATVSGLPGAHRAIDRQPAEAGLSIVVPVYNEGAGLPRLHGSLTDVIERLRLRWGLGLRDRLRRRRQPRQFAGGREVTARQ